MYIRIKERVNVMNIYDGITKLTGNTPLVRINRLKGGNHVTILAKLEYFNPLSSVKDHIAKVMIEDAEKRGLIGPGSVIIWIFLWPAWEPAGPSQGLGTF
ncbi:MAG: cystathionine beta-synthase [Candidatus Marinimicrobia bacterium]|nr:cystathionine beta-synthase [Candidatus Neomarinimicrobiota bacterium]